MLYMSLSRIESLGLLNFNIILQSLGLATIMPAHSRTVHYR
jgi:hypothetical protein